MHVIRKVGLTRWGVILCALVMSQPTYAQTVQPVPPETITRSADGTVNIRAVRIPEGLTLDGRLDEQYYRDIPSISGFTQLDPVPGAPATEKTDVWSFLRRYQPVRNCVVLGQ